MDKQLGKTMYNLALTQMARLRSGNEWTPSVDVYESDRELLLCMELAGVDPENIKVIAEQEKITISGVRHPLGSGFSGVHQLEIEFGAFSRSITLPAAIDVNATSSTIKNGFLTVSMPKLRACGRVKIQLT